MFNEFKNKYLGKSVDIDGVYGSQCVDLFNAWNRDYNGVYISCKPDKFAKGLAIYKNSNGMLKYFKETTVNNMIEGTVVVYGKCKFAPSGHVCFFIKDNGNGTYQALQQNHNNKQYVTIDNNPYDGIIGAFIPNQLVRTSANIDELAKAVIRGEYGNGAERKQKLGTLYNQVQARVNEMLGGSSNSVNIDELAKAVIRGDYGNGEERKQKLGSLYNQVQARVNEMLNNG